jgi:hypothetical protein
VGIANVLKLKKFDRVHRFENQGWELLKIYHYEKGSSARQVEKSVFQVIRNELKIPKFLNKEIMKRHRGETETFSADSISSKKVFEILKNADKSVKSKDSASAKSPRPKKSI